MDRKPKIEEHQSFGCVEIGRTGGGQRLFGSRVLSSGCIVMTFHHARSELRASDVDMRPQPTGQLLQVAMTEQQFFEMLTSMNVGHRTPCTIGWTERDGDIEPPPDSSATDEFVQMFRDDVYVQASGVVGKLRDRVKALTADRKATWRGRDLVDLVGLVDELDSAITQHVPWLLKVFGERKRAAAQQAKAEVAAFARQLVETVGLDRLRDRDGQPIIVLPVDLSVGKLQLEEDQDGAL